MKLRVLQESLHKALTISNRFVNSRAQLPVLANILLSVKKNKLTVSSTNLEISVSTSIGARIEKDGEITVPSKIITDLISNLSTEYVNLDAEKERVRISSGNFKSVISGMNAGDFPSIPFSVGKKTLKFPKNDLNDALSSVLFAVSSDETRPVLTGVLMIFKNKELFLVATDGFRLSQKKLKIEAGMEQKMILPKNALSELSRLSDSEEVVEFSYGKGENQAIFGVGDSVLATRVIEGQFPDFKKIIPKTSNYKISLDKEEFLQAVKLASVFARDSANVVKLAIKKDSILISAESKQSGSQEMSVDAKVEGDKSKLEIAFNYRFLEDFLNFVKGEDVQVELSNANAPGVFTDPKDSNYLHLIMPVRLQG